MRLEKQPVRGKETQKTELSEEAVSGRKTVPNCVNAADLEFAFGDSTVGEFMGSKA